jgi:dihydroflavonol-4-reductase
VDVRDAADAFVAALTRGEIYGRHLIGVNMSFADFLGRLNRLTGVPAPKLRVPSTVNVLGAKLLGRWAKARGTEARIDPHSVEIGEHFFYLDASKSEHLLNFHPRDPHQTLYETVQYLLSKMPAEAIPGVKGKLRELRQE